MMLSLEMAFNALWLDPACLLSEKLGKSQNPDGSPEVFTVACYLEGESFANVTVGSPVKPECLRRCGR